MEKQEGKLRVAFIHPDLGIGGAERLVVDAALGLQRLGHDVDIYTSHHDPGHCFEETRDGTLRVHNITPPFPRSYRGKFHILFAHLRQLHLTYHLLHSSLAPKYDVFFVDQLSTCVPFLRSFARRRVLFYVHFPDKLLAHGEFVAGKVRRKKSGLLKRLYRLPMDWLEEVTTGSADVLLANSRFTVEVFSTFFRIPRRPRVVYPGINLAAYAPPSNMDAPEIQEIISDCPTLVSLNRFEKKKNIKLALKAFAKLRCVQDVARKADDEHGKSYLPTTLKNPMRLVLAGGFDPRLQDNIDTVTELISIIVNEAKLGYYITAPSSSSLKDVPFLQSNGPDPERPPRSISEVDVLLLFNFSTPQRSSLLNSPSTIALLYTPANEHFGIGPVEAMACGLPVLACDSGGPTESVLTSPPEERTGWLCPPDADEWCKTLMEIIRLSEEERKKLAERAKKRARELFGMEAMAKGIEEGLVDAVKMGPVTAVERFSWIRWNDLLVALGAVLLVYCVYGFMP